MRMKIPPGFHLRRIVKTKVFQTVRKFVLSGHTGTIDQDGNCWNASLQRRLDLDADGIALILDSCISRPGRTNPLRSNNRDQNLILQQGIFDMFAKIRPEWYAVYVHENGIVSVMLGKPVADTAGDRV